ncbi:HlyD family secretion protein [Ectopseudomonas khazarica]|uniref:HlyD family secretion protein n=1 Tax=Ectopseudomonas khazarica TaxID=2502979 RepID=UPI00106EBB0F|nr:biotin/lipoyl-binding protein [Pseudomonas khazarica]
MAIDRRLLCLLLVLPLAACNEPAQQPLLGTLEWDRIGLPAEVSERVLEWKVSEGEQVVSGQLLLELDPRRLDARVRQAEAELNQANARLEELSNGARIEQIQAASASLQQARAERDEAVRDERRISALYARGQVAVAERDRARATRDRLVAASEASAARLRELTNGTRPEQVEQASAAVEAATAQLERLRLDREHLSLHAPRAGRVDALPFHPGDQPPMNAELVSLLVGEAPYARLFVPASVRPTLDVGATLRVRVEGHERPLQARIRSIASEASFTPYYALNGDDASRLTYRAEAVLLGDEARDLPAGLPLQAERSDDE